MKRVLCVWFPDWPLQRLYVARCELKSRAVVLYATGGRRGSTIVLCSRKAWQRGLRPGMPLAEAMGVASEESPKRERKTPRAGNAPRRDGEFPQSAETLHRELYDPEGDRAALVEMAEWCERYSPLVGLEESAVAPEESGDTLLAEVGGCAHLFGGEERLAAQVLSELRARGYEPRVAIAETIGAAWAAARFDERAARAEAIVPTGETEALLAPLPVAALRLTAPTIATLYELGLETIEQLWGLKRDGLAARLGAEVLARIDQALGSRMEVIRAHRAPPPLEIDWCFEFPIERRAVVESALEQMLERLAARLDERGQGVEQLECRLYLTSGQSLGVQIGTVRPRSSAAHLIELVRLPLERVRLSAPVTAVRVQALLTAPAACEQREMFLEAEAEGQQRLAKLLERLAGRLGSSQVVRPSLAGDPQPERGFRYEPLVTSGPKRRRARKREAATTTAHRALLARPLVLLPRPLRAEVWAIVPNGPLARFRCSLADERVARSWGPERIETGWWRGAAVRRDYYQVETASGRRYWLYCRLRDARWFVHGLFE